MPRNATTFNIRKESYDRCLKFIESGEFDAMASMVTYAIRSFYYHLVESGTTSIDHIVRKDLVRISLRPEDFVFNQIIDMGICSKSEIPDYALNYFLTWRGGLDDKG